MKKALMFLVLALSMISAPLVNAGEIIDVSNGNGIRVYATLPNIRTCIDFSKNEPDGSMQELVKYSIPYDPNDPVKSDGYIYAKGGEVFEGHIGYPDHNDLIADAVVRPGGKGPLCWDFSNPTKAGQAPVDMVFWVVLKGTTNQFICPPWEPTKLYFARPNPRHPKGTQHSMAFAVSGDKVYDVVAKAAAKGWKPAYVYWREKGVMGPPSWELENLMTGQAPADPVRK